MKIGTQITGDYCKVSFIEKNKTVFTYSIKPAIIHYLEEKDFKIYMMKTIIQNDMDEIVKKYKKMNNKKVDFLTKIFLKQSLKDVYIRFINMYEK
jgi:hypothetical protein